MLNWETGVAFGQALERLRSVETRQDHLEASVEKVHQEVCSLKHLILRGVLLVAIWAAGLMLNLPAERAGEITAAMLKALTSR